MGIRCLILFSGVSVLLALLGLEVKNSGAVSTHSQRTDFCPPCLENAICPNSPHCSCEGEFESMSGKKYFIKPFEKCEDNDQCNSTLENCAPKTYCINIDGFFNCSCVIEYPTFKWLNFLITIFRPGCYDIPSLNQSTILTTSPIEETSMSPLTFPTEMPESKEETSETTSMSPAVTFFGKNLSNDNWKNVFASTTSPPHQSVESTTWNGNTASPGKPEMSDIDKGISFKRKEDRIFNNKQVQRCQGKAASVSFCALMNSTFNILDDAWKNTTSSLKKTAESFGGVLKQSHTWSEFTKEETSSLATVLLESVESITLAAFLKPSVNACQTIQTEYLDIESKVIKEECIGENISFNLKAKGDAMKIGCSTVEESESSGTTGVAFASFEGMESVLDERFFQDPQDPLANSKRKLKMNSRIVRGIMTGEKKDGFSDPVYYTLQNNQPKQKFERPICASWDTDVDGGRWIASGCEVLDASETHTVCSCKRLANLAIIMASMELTMEYSLSIISHVGLVISLVCLVCAIATFLLCRSIHNRNTDLHLHLCVCLFLAKILFLTGVNRTENKLGCAIIAGFLHYLFLACFFWMLVEAVMLFLMVRNLKVVNYFSSRNVKMLHLCAFAYGLPGLVVVVSASVQPKGYGMRDRCWLNTETGFIWSFLGPVCTIIMINSTLLTWTLLILKQKLSSVNAEVSTLKDTRLLTFKAFAQVFILGCSWVLGIFQIGAMARVMAYLFTVINSLQGAFIFLIHCLLSRQVREEYRRWFTAKTKLSSQSQTSGIVLSSLHSSSKMG
ncbi:adhesion G protein-coupled receptor E1-like [Dasypus novemcinctus]|uniref:adhesion G protein-coupled receptor E1-like n=1 Tax=Dasypus novemcinctus TaxID=9361 RepID=UPI00265FE1D8|nr:adhesion G protein-coupled receptor E1-like [Dasypus novemcinctus]